MVASSLIEEAIRVLRSAAPEAEVILFGSYARGDARPDSDVDFLVVIPDLKDRLKEMVRLTEILRPLRIPADVIVMSRERFEYWRDTPNTLVHRAVREGRAHGQVG
ncbi:MAG: nucleotidyltransferase domain-containing protein [Myxococcales bacterium]|nr:MAG: nucleotidyltransferase domain-containing protein [Myxococcales bacterium]